MSGASDEAVTEVRRSSGGAGSGDAEAAMLAAAFEFAAVPLFVIEAGASEPTILFANHAVEHLTGRAAGGLSGLDFWQDFWPVYAPGADLPTADRLRRGFADQRAGEFEIASKRPDGSESWSRLSLTPAFDRSGALAFLVCAHARAAAPSRAAEDLAQRAGVFTHDFNNLLQVMVGYVAIILSALDKPEVDHRRIRRGVEAIQVATARAATLIQSLGGSPRS